LMRLGVKDLNRLLKYFADLGYTIAEGPHAVLHDGSEIGSWTLLKESRVVGEVIAHYIDSHYYALMRTEEASDNEVLEALLHAHSAELWRVPVEDVVLIASEELLREIVKYEDRIPTKEAEEALAHYEPRAVKIIDRFLRRLLEQAEEQ